MDLKQVIEKAVSVARGRAANVPKGTSNWNKAVILADLYQQSWAAESGVQWRSLRRRKIIGTIQPTQIVYPIELNDLSGNLGDSVFLYDNGEEVSRLKIVSNDYLNELKNSGGFATFFNNQMILSKAYDANAREINAEIVVYDYIRPITIDQNTPEDHKIEVDRPEWLTWQIAAHFARDSYKKPERADGFIATALTIMDEMKESNSSVNKEIESIWTPDGAFKF